MTTKIARYGVAIVLLCALFYFRVIDLAELRKTLAHPGLLVLSSLLYFATIPICAARWHILLQSQGLNLRLWETTRIVAIAAFFTIFLPGAAGGDLMRGVYIYRASQGRRTGAVLSILVDRLIGLSGFIVLGVVSTLTRPVASYGTFEYGIFAMAALFLIGMALVFAYGHRIARLLSGLFAGRLHRLAPIVDEAGAALHQYLRAWRTVTIALAISFVVAVLFAGAIALIARAMEMGGGLSDVEYGIAGIYAMIANSVPFTPGGLGIGEGAFASACVAMEPAKSDLAYGTIFLILRGVAVVSTLPGLFVYVAYPQRTKLLVTDMKAMPRPDC